MPCGRAWGLSVRVWPDCCETVWLQWPVSKIERVNNLIVVTKENSTETLVAEVVVETVPLGVLKRGLTFSSHLYQIGRRKLFHDWAWCFR